jgi:hypothetical protein
MASLTIVVDGVGQKFPLDHPTVTLGRGLESDIRLKDIKASRRHCQVVKSAKGYQCVDLSSGNGTYLNGVQIKSQVLESGDKITIGSTTIIFEEAATPAPVVEAKTAASKTATGKMPAASPKAATAKIATAKVQVAPTRKVTARVDAVKPASQPALKPATQPVAKSGSRLSKTTARSGSSRPPRPAGDAPKKKSPLILIAIAAAAVVLAAGGGYYFFFRDSGDQVRTQVDQLLKKGKEAEEKAHLDEAIQEYKKALELCQGDRYKVKASDIRTLLQQIEARRAAAGGGGSTAKPDPKEPSEKLPDLQAKRTEIADRHKLSGDSSAADWGGAVREWNEIAARKPSGELASKAQEEIRAITGKAREDLERLRKKAEALAQENKMAEAMSLLKQQLPRFESTDLLAELQSLIKQYDK